MSEVARSPRRRLWTAAQFVLLTATLGWAGLAVRSQWSAVRHSWQATDVHWGWVGAASVIVLGTYATLIQSWRMLVGGWGGRLPFAAATRIWTIANLGRYIPGKLWSVGALGVPAILGTLLNIGAGFGIMALSSSRVLSMFKPWLQTVSVAVSIAFGVGTLLLPWILPPVLRRVAFWRSQPPPERQLPAGTLWIATGINALSWVLYGLAFAAFARGVAPQVIASPALFIVIWAASYLGGYLVLFAPGGIGVRDVVLTGGLIALGLANSADATLLALASRVWLTVLEILPGVLALLWSPLAPRAESRRARSGHRDA